MPDMQNVTILDNVFLAFKPQCSLGPRGRLGTGFQKLIPTDRLGADEVMLEVGVNSSGSLWRL